MATSQLPSYEYDRRGDFACSRLPCCSTFNHIVSKTTRAKLKILGLFRPFHGELVHLQPPAHHGCFSVPWRIRSPAMEPRFEVKTCWERGAWGIHSARVVPAQCPRQCPPGKQSSARGSLVPGKKAEASIPTQEQKKRGHCFVFQAGTVAGTVRALRGHCAGTVYSLGAALPAGGRQPPPWRPPVATPWPPTRSYLRRRPQRVISKGHAAEETTPRM